MHDVAWSAIDDYVSRRAQLRDAILHRVVERDRELLDRLAE